MKKVFGGILLFIVVFALSFVLHFPTENLIRYYLHQMEVSTRLSVEYATGQFHLTQGGGGGGGGATLEDVDVLRGDKRLINFDRVTARFRPGKLDLEAKRNGGTLNVNVDSGKVILKPRNLKLVTAGKKFFKKIDVQKGSFTYSPRQKTGTGSFTLDMRGPTVPMIPGDVQAECQTRLEEGSFSVNLTRIIGNNLSGTGALEITIDRKVFDNSKLNGNLRLNSNTGKLNLRITGTIKEPKVAPVLGGAITGGKLR